MTIKKPVQRGLLSLFLAMILLNGGVTAIAAPPSTRVAGVRYEFDGGADYEFSKARSKAETNDAETVGVFSLSGDVTELPAKNGVSAYEVNGDGISFVYAYVDKYTNTSEDAWHFVDDSSKYIDTVNLDAKIEKGVILVQSSMDRMNWTSVAMETNLFEDTPVNTLPIYKTQEIQLINGCYYRVIVAYKLERRTKESSFLFFDTSDYERKKCAEVYEFYACKPESVPSLANSDQTYRLGSAVRCSQFDGYAGTKPIEKDDPHYNVTIGQFFVSGYTDKTSDKDGNMVFLKNVGDRVTLWFQLKENIDAIQGNKNISVTPDRSGSDQYFQIPTTDFGRGALIIRHTDHNNNPSAPQIYTNYLEANTSLGANTKVDLLEEGDYEVALDYELTKDKLIDSEGHYRIYFEFSIRNGNCMVFPFDLKTGGELTNSAITENGFRLDLARSRYLRVNLKREILTDSADGLVEDTRFNGPAKDGAEYTEEGIYTITVSNPYTGQLTAKKIYVGTNNVMKAHVVTGLSIPELNDLVADGASIDQDGVITLAATATPAVEDALATPTKGQVILTPLDGDEDETPGMWTEHFILYVASAVAFIAVALAVVLIICRKKKAPAKRSAEDEDGSVKEEETP